MRISEYYPDVMNSYFKKYLCGMIRQQQAFGYKYENQISMLIAFDRFMCERYPDQNELTKEIAEAWVEENGIYGERARRRALIIRQFGEYLQQKGISAYLHPKRKYRAPEKYIPYIFTQEQIKSLFYYADEAALQRKQGKTHRMMPMILKILYGCGLRRSEAMNLKKRDFDLEIGVLKIWDSKNHKDRLIPMSSSLWEQTIQFVQKYGKDMPPEAYLFSETGETPFSSEIIYNRFRDILFECGIPHRGKGYGPRLHDLRHTFAVHSLKQLADSGEDLYTILPVLSKYLGHSSVSATQYYLRLTSEMYPDVINRMEANFGDIYPEVFINE